MEKELPHHIAIADSIINEKYYLKFVSAVEIGEYVYIIKLPIALFRMFIALATASVTSQTGFATHKNLYTPKKRMPPGTAFVRTTLARLEKQLIEQTGGKWQVPIERNSYRKQARLNIAEPECRFEFNLHTLETHAKDKHVRDIAKRIAATWDGIAEPDFKKKEFRRRSNVEIQKRGCFLVRAT